MIFTIIAFTVFLCWLSAMVFLHKEKDHLGQLKWFLAISTVAEFTGYLVYFVLHHKNNYWVFNAFLFVEIYYLSLLFYRILTPYYHCRPWIICSLLIFSVLYFTESIRDSFLGMSMIAKNFASVYLILLSCSYFYNLLKSDTYIELKRHPEFWIVTGCFFFYFGSVTCDFFFDYLLTINKISLKPVRYIIFIVLNLILYGCWTYSFICRYRQTISSRSSPALP